ncbi:MAG: hypothetical protein GY750_14100 [Lentisphaerae bacterium]|nr:hypothetical protein [Lentisphaerota bacterium]MCP4102532.1 hypothetical protein [Lentisphaerota bacterium]
MSNHNFKLSTQALNIIKMVYASNCRNFYLHPPNGKGVVRVSFVGKEPDTNIHFHDPKEVFCDVRFLEDDMNKLCEYGIFAKNGHGLSFKVTKKGNEFYKHL